MNKKMWIKNEIIFAVIIPVVFAFIGFGMKLYFQDNAFPVDYETIDSYDWSDKFFSLFLLACGSCAAYNMLIAFIGGKFEIHSRKAWVVYGVVSLALSIAAPIYMCFNYREESFCTIIMVLMFVFTFLTTFLVSTFLCPKHWDFFPFR